MAKLDVEVFINADSRYKFDRKMVREAVKQVLMKEGLLGKVEVGLSVVGDRKMKQLNAAFRKKPYTTDVLSFPLEDTISPQPFIGSPDSVMRLGDIVISYPVARDQAAQRNVMLDEEIVFLTTHGLLHLLGHHHDEDD